MNAIRNIVLALATVSSLAIAGGAPANACGIIGCIVNQVAPGVGDQLDDWHNRAGRPLDHLANQAAGSAADYVAPGSGPFVTEGLELRDRLNRMNNGNGAPAVAAPQFGNFCSVLGAGRFGPGPVNPLGAPCNVPGPYGLMFGQVTQ